MIQAWTLKQSNCGNDLCQGGATYAHETTGSKRTNLTDHSYHLVIWECDDVHAFLSSGHQLDPSFLEQSGDNAFCLLSRLPPYCLRNNGALSGKHCFDCSGQFHVLKLSYAHIITNANVMDKATGTTSNVETCVCSLRKHEIVQLPLRYPNPIVYCTTCSKKSWRLRLRLASVQ